MNKSKHTVLALIAITALGPEHWIISLLFMALVLVAWRGGAIKP